MTAANVNLARLPLEIFHHLVYHDDDDDDGNDDDHACKRDPSVLREAICKTLISLQIQQRRSSSQIDVGNRNNDNNIQQQQLQHGHSTHKSQRASWYNHELDRSGCTKWTDNAEMTPIAAVATVGLLLQTSNCTLLRGLDPLLTIDECEELRHRICLHCAAVPSTALSMLESITRQPTTITIPTDSVNNSMILSTGIPTLDQMLQGGVRVGAITELVGRAGVGKSQLAYQLCCVCATRHGYGSVYVDTERKLQLSRLQQIAQYQQARQSSDNGCQLTSDVMSNVTIHTPTTSQDLLTTVTSLEDEILYRNSQAAADEQRMDHHHHHIRSNATSMPVRLIVIDSIAAPIKRDLSSSSLGGANENPSLPHQQQRVPVMLQCAQILKRLASQFELVVIVINQASVGFEPQQQQVNANTAAAASTVRAALGTAWHHCVSTRLFMDYDDNPKQLDEQQTTTRDEFGTSAIPPQRSLSVVKSNVVGYSKLNYKVTDGGIVESKG